MNFQDLPPVVLAHVCDYLPKTSCYLLAAAVTAPSSSWQRSLQRDSDKPNEASEAILEAAQEPKLSRSLYASLARDRATFSDLLTFGDGGSAFGWAGQRFTDTEWRDVGNALKAGEEPRWMTYEDSVTNPGQGHRDINKIQSYYTKEKGVLDFIDVPKVLAFKITDADLCAVLLCIMRSFESKPKSKITLREVLLTDCYKIIGHGLEPLRDCPSLETVDLSVCEDHKDGNIGCDEGRAEANIGSFEGSDSDADIECIEVVRGLGGEKWVAKGSGNDADDFCVLLEPSLSKECLLPILLANLSHKQREASVLKVRIPEIWGKHVGELCRVSVYSKSSFTYYCSSSPIQSATGLLKKLFKDRVLDYCLSCGSVGHWEVCNVCLEMQCSECVGTKIGVHATIWECVECETTTCLSCRVFREKTGEAMPDGVVTSCSEKDPVGRLGVRAISLDNWPHLMCGQCRLADCEDTTTPACFRCKSYAFDLSRYAKRPKLS